MPPHHSYYNFHSLAHLGFFRGDDADGHAIIGPAKMFNDPSLQLTEADIRAKVAAVEAKELPSKLAGFKRMSALFKHLPYLSYKSFWCMPVLHALLFGVVHNFVEHIFRPLQDTSRRGQAKAASDLAAAHAKAQCSQDKLENDESDARNLGQRASATAKRNASAAVKASAKALREAQAAVAAAEEIVAVASGHVVMKNIVGAHGRALVKAAARIITVTTEFGKGYRCVLKYRYSAYLRPA
jgi:hypothetical protein